MDVIYCGLIGTKWTSETRQVKRHFSVDLLAQSESYNRTNRMYKMKGETNLKTIKRYVINQIYTHKFQTLEFKYYCLKEVCYFCLFSTMSVEIYFSYSFCLLKIVQTLTSFLFENVVWLWSHRFHLHVIPLSLSLVKFEISRTYCVWMCTDQ